jgi:hypothetical protein
MNRLKFNEIKYLREKMPIYMIDDDGAKKSLFIFYFEFEYRNHRTIKRDANGSLKMSKCLIEMPTTHERHKSHTCALSFSHCFCECRKLVNRSDRRFSAKLI